jgi:hypothetical protein
MDEKPCKASDIVFQTVYTLSMDMIRLVHALVDDATRLEGAFVSIAKSIQDVNDNLQAHIAKKDWMSKPSLTDCKKKMAQSKELVDMCLTYSRLVRSMTDQAIKIAEDMEKNKKLADISDYVVRELEIEHSQHDDEEPESD